MADTGIFATTAQVQKLVPYGASATANTESYINDYMYLAESYINTITRYNWSDVYLTLNVDVKGILTMTSAAIAAGFVINYDTRGFPGLSYAQDYKNWLWTMVQEGIKLLSDQKVKDFATGA